MGGGGEELGGGEGVIGICSMRNKAIVNNNEKRQNTYGQIERHQESLL